MNNQAIDKVCIHLKKALKQVDMAGCKIVADQLFHTQKIEKWHSVYGNIESILDELENIITELETQKER